MSSGAQVRLIPPLVYIGPLALTGALQRWRPWTIPGGGVLTVVGIALVLIAIALTIWAVATFRAAHTTVIPWEQVSAIVTSGPFGHSRNPIYLADAIAYVGLTLIIHSWWPLLLLPGVLWVIRGQVVDREEAYLSERFGDEYRAYQLQVRRWL